ncbi:putative glycolipid-binding domain-containing protein [Pseudobacter ginsenosidimutans]|uniref:Glycolipid-binding protein n=1 Tax=Pseudobacter ginsenosidimutans TaxID=661488 RepID=A0A4Q7MQX8_9BACT|nr:putative glycolipid-binding domain-containing protein [Pseudobacter ginsenosidimutans]QEC42020.1 hypothetical protein FSB84_10095 [Pseudobacter ginsenosidimutans]RZS71146.1 hypothetical protein EV199_3047 [Pseudobacter ginsenosidimutans]
MKKKTVVWKGCYSNTTEYMELVRGESIIVRGHITGEEEGKPYYASYILHLNLQWEVQSVSVMMKSDESVELFFEKKPDGWFDKDGKALVTLKDCTDIDISLTPFTNTLPVRRLEMPRGATREITVLYFKLPEGEFYPMQQSYTNIDDRFYKYENIDGGYAAVLELDKDGIVVYYPGRWQRVFP